MEILHPLQSLRDNFGDETCETSFFTVKQNTLLLDDRLQREGTLGSIRLSQREDVPQLCQLIVELLHVALVVELREALRSPFLSLKNRLLIVLSETRVNEVSANEYGGPALAGVAVDEDLASSAGHEVHDLHDVEELVELRVGEVLPVAVEEGHLVPHEQLGRVRETRRGDDPVPAVRVLAWLLQVKHSRHALPTQLKVIIVISVSTV